MKIYLDTCCYNRPYDDQSQYRIRMESVAIIGIVGFCKIIGYGIVGSSVVTSELGDIRDITKRKSAEGFYNDSVDSHIMINRDIVNRVAALKTAGVGVLDSYHLACAEAAGANFLLTTDDRFENTCKRLNLTVKVINPLNFSIGEIRHESGN